MAELVLVRHAATAWSGRRYCGRSDPPLNRAGVAAAARVAAEMRPSLEPGIRIVSSPRRRALQTATAIASVVASASVELDDRWAETDFGIAEGLTFDELALVAPDVAARLAAGEVDIDWPGGESAAALVARVEAAWRDVVSGPEGTLVVTHGGPIRVAISLATDRPAADLAVPEPGGVWRASPVVASGLWRVQGHP
jgi:broad specificity phosphatase PhoE